MVLSCMAASAPLGNKLSGRGVQEVKNKMKGRILLDVIVRQSVAILKLFACEDKEDYY